MEIPMKSKPRAAARWLLPPPGGPNNSKLAPLFSQASPAASAITWALLTTGTASKSKLSRVFPSGNRASARWRSSRRRLRSAISCSAATAAVFTIPVVLAGFTAQLVAKLKDARWFQAFGRFAGAASVGLLGVTLLALARPVVDVHWALLLGSAVVFAAELRGRLF